LALDFAKVDIGDEGPHARLFSLGRKRVSELVQEWPEMSQQEKDVVYRERYEKEDVWVGKVVAAFDADVRGEIHELWREYETGALGEGQFANQIGALENLIQALWRRTQRVSAAAGPWWEHAKKVVDHPRLLEYMSFFETREEHGDVPDASSPGNVEKLFRFLEFVDGLKRVRRKVGDVHGKPVYESIADHGFSMTWMTWMLGARKEGAFDLNRAIKIALIHDLAKAEVGELGPYAELFSEGRKRTGELVGEWPTMNQDERSEIFQARHEAEREWVERLTSLIAPVGGEMMALWLEYEAIASPEARFVYQIGVCENIRQAVYCHEQDASVDLTQWWFHAKKSIDDPVLLEFIVALEQKG